MSLYKHYKNKLYRFRNIVKHSESLEDLVFYEALYPNELGNLWVRPRDMFFENIDVGGIMMPRFAPLPYQIECHEVIGGRELQIVSQLGKAIFESWNEDKFIQRCREQKNICLVLASLEGDVVGFKLGYEQDQKTFYSWLGGVLPQRRGFGFAHQMMLQQHEWCRKQGYKEVRTKTRNQFKDMLILNLKHNFFIAEVYKGADHQERIVMVKHLD